MPTVIYDGEFEVVYPHQTYNQDDHYDEEENVKISDDSDKLSRDEYLDY